MTNDTATDLGIDDGTFSKGLNTVVKDNDLQYPPRWRLSRSGRGKL